MTPTLPEALARYDLQWTTRAGSTFEELTRNDTDGEWVRYEDVAREVQRPREAAAWLRLYAGGHLTECDFRVAGLACSCGYKSPHEIADFLECRTPFRPFTG